MRRITLHAVVAAGLALAAVAGVGAQSGQANAADAHIAAAKAAADKVAPITTPISDAIDLRNEQVQINQTLAQQSP